MNKRTLLIVAVVILAVCVGFWRLGATSPEAQKMPQGQPIPVTVAKVKKEIINYTIELPGRITPFKVAEIRPQVSGIIIERAFTEGETVQEGDHLYQIDPATYKAAYDSAKAELQRARANAKSVKSRTARYRELVEIDAVSKQEYDDIQASLAQAEADIAVAQAKVKQAKINVDYTKVYAPISGRIGTSAVTEGALVTANQAQILTKITQLDPVYVDMTQSSTELMQLRRQLGELDEVAVQIHTENNIAYAHEGRLQFSDVTVDETTGSVQLRALMSNPERELLPGLFVRANIVLNKQPALLIPQQAAIRDGNGDLKVWVVGEDNIVTPRVITTSRSHEKSWVVTSGLTENERVIIEGFQKIQPGATVNPTEDTTSNVAASAANHPAQ
ncbi:MAG: efflux RND transporter periplasmic adaptor subunit [Alphaproteobacteria bacterium]|nr:efflux RND transporter periplasmic adaptor subunit [Alphaproteobacteria bacterium]